MKPKHPAGPAMTLGNMRHVGVPQPTLTLSDVQSRFVASQLTPLICWSLRTFTSFPFFR
jgi:hypothetical protein